MKRYSIFVFAFLLFCTLNQVQGQNVYKSFFAPKDDPRLEHLVTVHANSIALGELLETLSIQSDFPLAIERQSDESGIPLVVHFQQITLIQALNSLTSFLSYREAGWHWEKQTIAGKETYLLQPSRAWKELPGKWRQKIQQDYEKSMAIMLEAAYLSSDERKKNKKQILEAYHLRENDPNADAIMEANWRWAGVRAFAESLTEGQRTAIAKGESTLRLKISDLPPQAQQFADMIWKETNSQNILPDGTRVPLPRGEYITVETNWDNHKAKHSVPTLMIGVEPSGSMDYLGGYLLGKGSNQLMRLRWLLDGDLREHPKDQQMIEDASFAKAFDSISTDVLSTAKQTKVKQTGLEDWQKILTLISTSLEVPLIAWIQDDSNGLGRRSSFSVTTLIQDQAEAPLTKWRGDTLMVCDPTWYLLADANTSLATLDELQASAKEGLFSIEALIKIYGKLRVAQVGRMETRFPVLRRIRALQPLLAYGSRFPEIATKGVALSTETLGILRRMQGIMSHPLLRTGAATSLRLSQIDSGTSQKRSREIRLELQDIKGKWIPVTGYVQVAQP